MSTAARSLRILMGITTCFCLLPFFSLAQAPATARPAAPAAASAGAAIDEIVIRSGAVYRGKVLSATVKGVKIELPGRGSFDVPREQIDHIMMSPPAAIVKGIQAYERGSMKEAIATLKLAIFQFQGMDTDWAVKGLLCYARACLADRNLPEAEKAFTTFLDTYPDHDNKRDADIGLAELEIERKQYDVALSNLLEMVTTYDEMLKPEGELLRQAAQLNRDIAQCYLGLERPEDALDSFTKVIALYPWPDYYPETLYAAAELSARLGRLQRADLIYSELLENYKEFPKYRDASREQNAIRQKLAAAEAQDAGAGAAQGK